MDKSEGKDFVSKAFSSISDTVSKLYHTGNMKLILSDKRRARKEKVQMLGNKVMDLMSGNKPVTKDSIKAEYDSIIDLDMQIVQLEEDIEKLRSPSAPPTEERPDAKPSETAEKTDDVKKAPRKTRTGKTTAAKTASAGAKKTAAPKGAPAKRGRKKTTPNSSNLPVLVEKPKKEAKGTQVEQPTPDVIAIESTEKSEE